MLATAAFALGFLLCVVSSIWWLVVTFRQSVWWFLACLFLPFASLIFLVKYWAEAWLPFLLSVVGLVVVMLGVTIIAKDPATLRTLNARAEGGRDQSSLLLAAVNLVNGAGAPPTTTSRMDPSASDGLVAGSGGAPAVVVAAAAAPSPKGAAASGGAVRGEPGATTAESIELRAKQVAERQSVYAKHRAEADALYASLNTRRTKLKVDDTKAVTTFNADAVRYGALLEQTRMDKLALDELTFGVNPSPPAPKTATTTGAESPKPEARNSKQARSSKSEVRTSKL